MVREAEIIQYCRFRDLWAGVFAEETAARAYGGWLGTTSSEKHSRGPQPRRNNFVARFQKNVLERLDLAHKLTSEAEDDHSIVQRQVQKPFCLSDRNP